MVSSHTIPLRRLMCFADAIAVVVGNEAVPRVIRRRLERQDDLDLVAVARCEVRGT